jgi:hypothetical protein
MNFRLTAPFALISLASSGLLLAQTPAPSSAPNSPESVAEEPAPPASDHTRSPSTAAPVNQAPKSNTAADAQATSSMARLRAQNAALSDQQLTRACTGTNSCSK